MRKEDFINLIAPLAQEEAKKRGNKFVLPSICIAQAALETGWGSSSIMTKANAFFGIKAGSGWKGKVYNTKTKECYDGVNYTTITDCFRAYDSLKDSVADYYNLITKNSRYKMAVGETDANKCITAIKNGGYATSPTYVKNVMSIVNANNLTQYDGVVMGGSSNNTSVTNKKNTEEVAKEVIDGKWGNGTDRKNRLAAAGYSHNEIEAIQESVNQKTKGYSKRTYKVKKGDTLSVIAKKYGTTVKAIMAENKTKYPKITAKHIETGWELTV